MSFRNKIDEDHHKQETPLTKLPIDMVKNFIVADPLHLIDLGNQIRNSKFKIYFHKFCYFTDFF